MFIFECIRNDNNDILVPVDAGCIFAVNCKTGSEFPWWWCGDDTTVSQAFSPPFIFQLTTDPPPVLIFFIYLLQFCFRYGRLEKLKS